jgi:hypothetical protein
MTEKTFFLISNGSSDIYSDNTLTNFRNRLPEIIELPENENWVAAVESVGFSNNFRNVYVPENESLPSFIISNCKKNIPNRLTKCQTIFQPELCPEISFNFEENEDMQNCAWDYHRFENKMYTPKEMQEFFFKIEEKKNIPGLYISYAPKLNTIRVMNGGNAENNSTHFWIMIHPTMMQTFNIPLTPELTGGEFWKKVGANKYILVKKDSGFETEVYSHTPFITYYKNEKYYAFDMYYKYPDFENNASNIFTNPEKRFPKLVKVVCGNITPQIFNTSYSQDLIVFCPDFNKKEKYYFKEFENKQYVSISNSMLSDFEVRLCDDENKRLQLLSGVPSIIKLSIKKMEEETFNVRLTSALTKEFPNNTNSSFKVKLPNTLSLNRNWRVSLTSINHPNIYTTFLEPTNSRMILFKYMDGDDSVLTSILFTFEKEKTYTKLEIIEHLNNFFFTSGIGNVVLEDDRVEISFVFKGYLIISNFILQVLGYNGVIDHSAGVTKIIIDASNTDIKVWEINEERVKYIIKCNMPVDLNVLRPDYIMAYTNIVSSTIIGGEYSKILRIIPIHKSSDDFVLNEFHHKEYIELQNTEINEIDVELRSHDGHIINFGTKKDVILNLEFKNENKKI